MAAIPILVIAVVQGWLLYGLHYSLEHRTWPAKETSWLFAFYAIALFVPVALEIFAARLPQRLTRALAGAIAPVAGASVAETGSDVAVAIPDRISLPLVFALYGPLVVAWC